MKSLKLAVSMAATLLGAASSAQAQVVYVQSAPPVFVAPVRPIAPVVSYSYYPPAAVAVAPAPVVSYAPAPTTTYYAGPPAVAYYPPAAVVAPSYGVYSTRTSTYGLGIFRPREVTTQYYYAPVYPR